MNKIRKITIPFLAILVTALVNVSCKTNYDNVKYLTNYATAMAEKYDTTTTSHHKVTNSVILPKDLLLITVSGITDETTGAMFNMVEKDFVVSGTRQTEGSVGNLYEYLVDNAGCIHFPVIGNIQIAGKTREEAQIQISDSIKRYLLPTEHPLVRITFQNYKFSVLGEVESPGMYSMDREDINIFDAIARAGDMTIYGRRDNVKLIREDKDGKKSITVLDLNDSSILTSTYYYLQQNDVIYVEPNSVQSQNARVGSMTQTWLSFASVCVSMGSLLYMILQ